MRGSVVDKVLAGKAEATATTMTSAAAGAAAAAATPVRHRLAQAQQERAPGNLPRQSNGQRGYDALECLAARLATTPWVAPARSSTGQVASYGAGQGGTTRGMHVDGKSERFGSTIPEDELDLYFTRLSGAGGQNVNELSTKVEIRFILADAGWLPNDVRIRLARQQAGRVNKEGELLVTSQEYRAKGQNRANAIRKLKRCSRRRGIRQKERRVRKVIGKAVKAMRRAGKEFRAKVKQNRGKVRDFD